MQDSTASSMAGAPDAEQVARHKALLRASVAAIQTLSPALSYTVTHVIAEGDLYAAHVRSTLQHTGEAFGTTPTGEVIACVGAYHCRIVNGLIAEDWDTWTLRGIFQQFTARVRG